LLSLLPPSLLSLPLVTLLLLLRTKPPPLLLLLLFCLPLPPPITAGCAVIELPAFAFFWLKGGTEGGGVKVRRGSFLDDCGKEIFGARPQKPPKLLGTGRATSNIA
jgi:hypothetical protein